jgi:L-ascorbate metabolism protein UlaG (beta-lactamase superfamily)
VSNDAWRITWLGQAGFMLDRGPTRIVIDPYLSDSLAAKYVGKRFPHVRMVAPPVRAAELNDVDYVLCTHAHSDHMDPGTLPVLAEASAACRFVVPRAERGQALDRGVPADRLVPINADESMALQDGLTLTALPAAHETLRRDDDGDYHCLGYVLNGGGPCLYHSGDTLDYAGLDARLAALHVDVALLPVNGRDDFRTSHGVLGNLHFEEAVDLCRRAGIPTMIPHHFGLFAENTIDENELQRKIAALDGEPICAKPEIGSCLELC